MIKKVMPLLRNLSAIRKFTDHKIVDSICLSVSKLVVDEARHLRDMLTFNYLVVELQVVSVVDFDRRVELNVLFKLFDRSWQLNFTKSPRLDYFLYKLGIFIVENLLNNILWIFIHT